MGKRRTNFVGRQEELAVLDTAWRDAADLVLVRGPAGIGKSALLAAAEDRWRPKGILVIKAESGSAQSISDAVRDLYEEIGDPQLAAALAWDLSSLFRFLAQRRPVVLLVDDMDRTPPSPDLLVIAAHPRCLVVAATREYGPAIADTVIDLGPLPAVDVSAMIARQQLDDRLLEALSEALGPVWFGNPETLLSIVDDLGARDRLATVRGHLCLIEAEAPIALPVGHELVARTRRLGPLAMRLATMAAITPLGVDDLPLLAEAMQGELGSYGNTADQLVRAGVLTTDLRGTLAPVCRALAARLIENAGPAGLTRLHRAFAAALFMRAAQGVKTDHQVAADHVASAGRAMPLDERTAHWLAGMAAVDEDRERAARWLRAAVWHAGSAPAATQLMNRLTSLLIRGGQYKRLSEVADDRDALVTQAMFAAIHMGTPLAGPTPRSSMAGLYHWWFGGSPVGEKSGGDPLQAAAEMALAAQGIGTRPLGDALLTAGSAGDLVAVFRHVLGPQYGEPVGGLLAAYHRLLLCFSRGDLAGALSAAREVEISGSGTTLAHHCARLFAAEAHCLRGDPKRAAQLLDDVPDDPAVRLLAAWVRCGLVDRFGDDNDRGKVLQSAWDACRTRPDGVRVGLEQLLIRLAIMAPRELTAQLLAEAEALHRRGNRITRETMLLIHGLVRRDLATASRGAALVARREHRPALAEVCLAIGALADDPEPWLRRASDLAVLIDARPTAKPGRGRARRKPLSAVDLHIIDLIRDGRTNRQVAAALRMSEKTIEAHLTRLFTRTGCRSRVELATASLSGRLHLEVSRA